MGASSSSQRCDWPELGVFGPMVGLPRLLMVIRDPWRDLPEKPNEIVTFVKSYKPANKNTSRLRILLHGPVGAGKSSFTNSVESAVLGRISGRNPTDAATGTSFTRKYKTCKIKKSEQQYCSLIFNDTMGYEAGSDGICVEDVELALKGHMKDNYKFDPDRPLTGDDDDYNPSPTLADKVHVLVIIFPVDTIDLITEDVWRKLRKVRLAARDLDIPQMAILTKVDEACPATKADVQNAYRSIYLKNQVDKFHQTLGIPLDCIFLVKNYVSEMKTDDVMDAQILLALRQMINFGENFLSNQD